ncbi:uncharacterized protein F5Z01DRAFT_506760 [Emericellopsis atlantica]|uniref:Uncharacterized protein n=1 Tax=Emericellopsis atlantica TaxID=2614577 RepID=A0A9P7ZR98_9HYPO|nr:uncharacterized protein F5Z01DRAFT_506760 [Emericellopsis atlantica]KAG9256352.1 hypothetical protein F5Z01DRAFT_506760 [Emericellopsis atlantica]
MHMHRPLASCGGLSLTAAHKNLSDSLSKCYVIAQASHGAFFILARVDGRSDCPCISVRNDRAKLRLSRSTLSHSVMDGELRHQTSVLKLLRRGQKQTKKSSYATSQTGRLLGDGENDGKPRAEQPRILCYYAADGECNVFGCFNSFSPLFLRNYLSGVTLVTLKF